jgi:hypothetical protein
MPDGGDESDQLLELQRRGLELATQEAEERRTEINVILSSRRVLLTAEQDPSVRDARLAILEELAHASYPSATVLAAARYLATVPLRRRIPRPRRLRQRPRVRGLRRVLGGTAALALFVVAVAALLAARTFNSVTGGNTLTVLLTCLPFVAGVVGAWSARHGARADHETSYSWAVVPTRRRCLGHRAGAPCLRGRGKRARRPLHQRRAPGVVGLRGRLVVHGR